MGDAANVIVRESHINQRDGKSPSQPFEEFLAAADADPPVETYSKLQIIMVHLSYAQRLRDTASHVEANKRLEVVRKLLDNVTTSESTLESSFPRIWLVWERSEILRKTHPGKEDFDQILALSKIALLKKIYASYRNLIHAAQELAEKLNMQDIEPETKVTMGKELWHELTELISFQGSVSSPAGNLHTSIIDYYTWNRHTRGIIGRQDFELLQSLLTRFPDFDMPVPLAHLLRTLATAATELGLHDEASLYYKRLAEVEPQCAGKYSVNAIQNPDLDDDTAKLLWALPVKDLGNDDDVSIVNKLITPIAEHHSLVCATLILRWVCWHLESGEMDLALAKRILRWDEYKSRYSDPDSQLQSGKQRQKETVDQTTDDPAIDPSLDEARVFAEQVASVMRPALFSQIFLGEPKPRACEDWEQWIDSVNTWLFEYNGKRPSRFQRLMIIQNLQYTRAVHALNMPASTMDDFTWGRPIFRRESQRLFDLFQQLRTMSDNFISQSDLDIARFHKASSVDLMAHVPGASEGTFLTDDDLQDAKSQMTDLLQDYVARDCLHSAYRSLKSLASMSQHRYKLFSTEQPWESLKYWEATEELETALRAESSAILYPTDSLQAKQRLSNMMNQSHSRREVISVCFRALMSCLTKGPEDTPDPSQTSKFDELLLELGAWAMRCKSRALGEILGSTVQPPAPLRALVDESAEIRELWKELENEISSLQDRDPIQRTTTREKIKSLSESLRAKSPIVASYLDMRDGRPVGTLSEQLLGSRDFGPSVVTVEWVEAVRGDFLHWDILLILHRQGKMIWFTAIMDYRMEDVEKWVKTNLEVEENDGGLPERPLDHRYAKEALNQLRPLVAPIEEYVLPDDTLVFCPTGAMHQLPLHAISLGGKPLIERNPIIYMQSLTLLHHCRHALSLQNPEEETFQAAIFNTLSENSTTNENEDLATLVEMMPNCDLINSASVTTDRKELFREKCRTSNLVHIYGHSEFDNVPERGIPTQCIELVEPSNSTEDEINLNEIFSTIRFRQPSIVLAMGCRTSRSRISDTNDLLGLTAAFHFAGAGTVIGALWKIWRVDAMRFSKTFYKELLRGMNDKTGTKTSGDGKTVEGEDKGVVNIAKAYQTAVLELRKDANGKFQRPYHWAGFVLHGGWEFPKMSHGQASDASSEGWYLMQLLSQWKFW